MLIISHLFTLIRITFIAIRFSMCKDQARFGSRTGPIPFEPWSFQFPFQQLYVASDPNSIPCIARFPVFFPEIVWSFPCFSSECDPCCWLRLLSFSRFLLFHPVFLIFADWFWLTDPWKLNDYSMGYLEFTLRRSNGWQGRLRPFSCGQTGGPRTRCRTSSRINAIASSFLMQKEGNCFVYYIWIYLLLCIDNLSFELNSV